MGWRTWGEHPIVYPNNICVVPYPIESGSTPAPPSPLFSGALRINCCVAFALDVPPVTWSVLSSFICSPCRTCTCRHDVWWLFYLFWPTWHIVPPFLASTSYLRRYGECRPHPHYCRCSLRCEQYVLVLFLVAAWSSPLNDNCLIMRGQRRGGSTLPLPPL